MNRKVTVVGGAGNVGNVIIAQETTTPVVSAKVASYADAAKKAADKAAEKARDIAHSAGKKMEEGAKKLKDA